MKKIIAILIILLTILTTTVFATINVDQYEPESGGKGEAKVYEIGKKFIGGIRGVGVIVAIAALVVMGIRLMTSAPSEKAAIKEGMVPYVVGATMLVAITTILQAIANIIGD